MRKWNFKLAIVAAFSIFVCLEFFGPAFAAAQQKEEAAAASEPASTTEKDQVDLNVTVYNSNVALVRDVRQIHLASGVFPLRFEDVAASINPATVHFRSLTDPAKLNVIEQNYEYDLLDPQKLLQKYVGREVRGARGTRRRLNDGWRQRRCLLSDNNGPVWKIGNEIVTGMPAGSYRFPRAARTIFTAGPRSCGRSIIAAPPRKK